MKLDDLQAFWDMVHLQVEALDAKFAHLEKLEQNRWCPVATEKKGRRGRKVCWGEQEIQIGCTYVRMYVHMYVRREWNK